jgi:hypothetical protein
VFVYPSVSLRWLSAIVINLIPSCHLFYLFITTDEVHIVINLIPLLFNLFIYRNGIVINLIHVICLFPLPSSGWNKISNIFECTNFGFRLTR